MREKLHALAEELLSEASWDDVIEEVRFWKAVDLGIEAAEQGAFATEEEVHNAFLRCGVKS
jgi:predicted transcriptional regulator